MAGRIIRGRSILSPAVPREVNGQRKKKVCRFRQRLRMLLLQPNRRPDASATVHEQNQQRKNGAGLASGPCFPPCGFTGTGWNALRGTGRRRRRVPHPEKYDSKRTDCGAAAPGDQGQGIYRLDVVLRQSARTQIPLLRADAHGRTRKGQRFPDAVSPGRRPV